MNSQLSQKLVQLRKQHGYSQEALAQELGLTRQAISKWETGETIPSSDNLIFLAKLYNISLDEIIGANSTPTQVMGSNYPNVVDSPSHKKAVKVLRIVGILMFSIGLILDIIGLADFFIGFNRMEMPQFTWVLFIGFPMTGIGIFLFIISHSRNILRFAKNMTVPVYKEIYHDVKPEVNDLVNTFKKPYTPENGNFCPHCGQKLTGSERFCPNCGKQVK